MIMRLAALVVSGILQIFVIQHNPGIIVTMDGVCQHETHEHADEDLRVRQAVLIDHVDACGFTYETRTDAGRLEIDDKTIIAEGNVGKLGQISEFKLLSREYIKHGRVAFVFFCQYCKHAVTVRMNPK